MSCTNLDKAYCEMSDYSKFRELLTNIQKYKERPKVEEFALTLLEQAFGVAENS